MPRIQLKIELSVAWIEHFSATYPDVEIRALGAYPREDQLQVLIEVETANTAAIAAAIDAFPIVCSSEVLHTSDQTLVMQFVMEKPSPYDAFSSAGVVLTAPLRMRNGWLLFESIATHDQLSYLKAGLDSTGMNYEITSITPLTDPDSLLTDRQRYVVTEAVTRGYYDSPRECSVTDLAAVLEISKSTASDILHRAEGHIIKEFITPEDGQVNL